MGVLRDIWDVLSTPFYRLLRSFVANQAKSLAVRQTVLRAAIRMYVDQYAHAGKVSADEAPGKAQRVWDRLSEQIHDKNLDVENETTLQCLKDEVAVACVPLSVWVILAAVPEEGAPASHQIGVVYQGSQGEETRTFMVLAHVQEYFLFHKPLILPGGAASPSVPPAKVSPKITSLMKRVLQEQQPRIVRVDRGPASGFGATFMS